MAGAVVSALAPSDHRHRDWQANLLMAARGAVLIVAFAFVLRLRRNALTWIALA